MEAHAVALGLNWLSHDVHNHGKRVTFLVDAKAVVGALKKGRTSAHTLKRAVRRCAATALASDILFHVAYVPSECNAADWPSRGLRYRQTSSRFKHVVRVDGRFVKQKKSRLDRWLEKQQKIRAWFNDWCRSHNIGESTANSSSVSLSD